MISYQERISDGGKWRHKGSDETKSSGTKLREKKLKDIQRQ